MTNKTDPLLSPDAPPPRWTGDPLPDYRHVPGLTPHPVAHPAGHSFGTPEAAAVEGSDRLPVEWRQCPDYLRGVDLFNRAYFWEAHESWEAVWHAVGEKTHAGVFLQALIQVAAALLQRHCGRLTGSRNLHRKADAKLRILVGALAGGAEAGATYMGLELEGWRGRVEAHLLRQGPFPFIRLAQDP